MRTLMALAMALITTFVVAGTPEQECVDGSVLYVGAESSSALHVDTVTHQAFYNRQTVMPPGDLSGAMRRSVQQRNATDCSTRGTPCIDIRLEGWRLLLAFRGGDVGFKYAVSGMQFEIVDKVEGFGFGLGDVYWIRYHAANGKGRMVGVFSYSSAAGITSISWKDLWADKLAIASSTLTLVGRHGLLAHTRCKGSKSP